MGCGERCQREQQLSLKRLQEFEEKFPGFCRVCWGWGQVSWMENVAGDGGSRMEMSDVCDRCVGDNKCPRCGGEFLEEEWDDQKPCRHCGWNYKSEGAPPEHECWCGEEDWW